MANRKALLLLALVLVALLEIACFVNAEAEESKKEGGEARSYGESLKGQQNANIWHAQHQEWDDKDDGNEKEDDEWKEGTGHDEDKKKGADEDEDEEKGKDEAKKDEEKKGKSDEGKTETESKDEGKKDQGCDAHKGYWHGGYKHRNGFGRFGGRGGYYGGGSGHSGGDDTLA